jgi:hypothetical protein
MPEPKELLRLLPLALVIMLASCIRNSSPPPVPVEGDKTIVFPQFFDGEMLRALMIAINDFLPTRSQDTSCPNSPESQSYRVIRHGNVVFVYIYENEAYCGRTYLALDSGAKYAISTDGRILRRVLDGQPDGTSEFEAGDGGSRGVPSRPGVTPAYDSTWNRPRGSVLPTLP